MVGSRSPKKISAFLRDAAQDAATVLCTSVSPDEPLIHQTVEQARDPRGPLDHTLTDLERGQRFTGAPENPKHVVLLKRDPGLDDVLAEGTSERRPPSA